jgi:hypothetical protein
VALWVAAGVSPKEVSIRAGHSSVAFTLDRYGHLYEDAGDDVPDRLDALFGRSRDPPNVPQIGEGTPWQTWTCPASDFRMASDLGLYQWAYVDTIQT